MDAVTVVHGTAAPLDRADVDTDQIVAARFLHRPERTGFADALFADWRRDPAFVLNRPEHRGAPILLAGRNIGCGSSREHAAWALHDHGFRAVVSCGLADIFRSNLADNGIVPVELADDVVARLFDTVAADPTTVIAIDVVRRHVTCAAAGFGALPFALDDDAHHRLVNGLDAIDLTLGLGDAITAHERTRPHWLPTARPA